MQRIKDRTSLGLLKNEYEIKLNERVNPTSSHKDILVCGGTGCKASQSRLIIENLQATIQLLGLEQEVSVVQTGCFGFCEKGAIVKIMPDLTFYTEVKAEDAADIVREHIVAGRKIERLLYRDPMSGRHIEDSAHMGFYKKQMRIALRNCGLIDPENIEEYIAVRGYEALADALAAEPQATINTIKESALRGRGGGGFPTGVKWEIASRVNRQPKYVVCNADEGDPGAFMDRSIMEGDPHSVIEAMTICGYAIGANKGLVYIEPNILWQFTGYKLPSSRLLELVCWAKISWVAVSVSTSRFALEPERSSVVKRRP